MQVATLMSNYGMWARDYLRRARQRLDDGTHEALFYAAFELRCGIESRMRQYLLAQEDVSRKRRKGWRLASLGKELEKAFHSRDRIAELTFLERDTKKVIGVYCYTPVTRTLEKEGERLGDYLHCMKRKREPSDQWWDEMRERLERTCQELEVACFGTLQGMPLFYPRTGEIRMNIEVSTEGEGADKNPFECLKGTALVCSVRYLESLPETRNRSV